MSTKRNNNLEFIRTEKELKEMYLKTSLDTFLMYVACKESEAVKREVFYELIECILHVDSELFFNPVFSEQETQYIFH